MRGAARLASAAVVLALAMVLAVALAWRGLDRMMDQPDAAGSVTRIVVAPGTGLDALLAQLAHEGLLRHPRLVELYLRLHGQRPRVQAGTYDIAAHASARSILAQLIEGRVVLDQFTIVDGWTVAQMRRALDADPQISHRLRGRSDTALMAALGHPGQPAEGRFFPDTYRFAAGTSDRRILELAYERMHTLLGKAWAQRAKGLPLTTPGQALTLASIIEKEGGKPDELSEISAVYINRLRRGMRLQADPTVIYGLGARYDGTIHARDLLTDTPYNTYLRAGLPPTPICLPGSAALQAALHPAHTDALYFVATGSGGHRFSATLAEHDREVRAYLRHIGVLPGAAAAHRDAARAGSHQTGSPPSGRAARPPPRAQPAQSGQP